ncbi:uncharacterized protein N0V89_006032 [Didymosphaeria variabile]|uniref:Uncharacterized protein n=1 Tax=Didymosphaeria variabile TaxID=1932322 RepID=A0A9W8XNB0_9PLEO|nr:uncharacterized protein N0V89_006032 [Didymosphaeria variabile]KAJ4354298.1 hypothetical protein N0V89_006032 [Didymosphaeria variabile]
MAPIPRNKQDGDSNNYKHHCGLCGGAPSWRCFKQNHVAYCEACGDVFTVKSSKSGGGCHSHPYAKGYNMSYKKIKQNLPADYRSKNDLQLEAEAQEQMANEAVQRQEIATEHAAAKQQQAQTKKDKKKIRLLKRASKYQN